MMNKRLIAALAAVVIFQAMHACDQTAANVTRAPSTDKREYYKYRVGKRRAELCAITDEQIMALANKHGLPPEIVEAARRDYKRRGQRVTSLTGATAQKLQDAARRSSILKQTEANRFRERRAALEATITDDKMKALAQKHGLPLVIVHNALQRYKSGLKKPEDFMNATTAELELEAQRYRERVSKSALNKRNARERARKIDAAAALIEMSAQPVALTAADRIIS